MFPCNKIEVYIKMNGYSSSSKSVQGVIRHEKEGHEAIWTRCEDGAMTETVVRVNILKKTGHDFDFFKNLIAELK